MKEITELFTNKDIIFSSCNEIKPKEINSKKNIQIYECISVDNNYYAIFVNPSKSRFVQKSVNEYEDLYNTLTSYVGHNFKYKYIILPNAPLCSKAKKLLETLHWSEI